MTIRRILEYPLATVLAAMLAVAVVSCDTPTATSEHGGVITAMPPQAAEVVHAIDAADIRSASVDGDTLVVNAEHGGGCAAHSYALEYSMDDTPVVGEVVDPVPVRLHLTHDAHGDRCLAYIHRTLRFNLAPMLRMLATQRGLRAGTTIQLLLSDPKGKAAAPMTVVLR